MKTKNLIYGSIFTIFAGFILFYLTGSYLLEDITILLILIVLSSALLSMIIIPLIMIVIKPPVRTYWIKKGKHYALTFPRLFITKKRMKVSIRFGESWRYNGDNVQIQEQISKVCGFGSLDIHKDSIRLGCRYNQLKDKMDLFLYEYKNGVRMVEFIKSVNFNEYNDIKFTSEKRYWFGRYSFPYYGGQAPAPNNVSITIKF